MKYTLTAITQPGRVTPSSRRWAVASLGRRRTARKHAYLFANAGRHSTAYEQFQALARTLTKIVLPESYIALAGGAAFVLAGRRRLLRWGATAAEIGAVQPGDGLIAGANVTATRAITIRRSPEVVWPWVVQLGQGRGGFYSYDKLENLLGFDIHSADRVVAEWQQLNVGDEVRLAPTVGLKATIVHPRRALVLQGALPLAQAPPFDSTWAFILCEQPDGSTRLLSRERYGYKRWWAPFVVEPTQAASFVMSRKMLLGIRDRAERSPLVAPSGQAVERARRQVRQ